MNLNIRCANDKCKDTRTKILVSYSDGTDNIDNLSHARLKCPICNYEFNHWNAPEPFLKTAFGHNYKHYL